jgi:hypothetical protein
LEALINSKQLESSSVILQAIALAAKDIPQIGHTGICCGKIQGGFEENARNTTGESCSQMSTQLEVYLREQKRTKVKKRRNAGILQETFQ